MQEFDGAGLQEAMLSSITHTMRLCFPVIMGFILLNLVIGLVIRWLRYLPSVQGEYENSPETFKPVKVVKRIEVKRSAASLSDVPGPVKPVSAFPDLGVWVGLFAQVTVLGFVIMSVVNGEWFAAFIAVLVFSGMARK